MTAYSASRSSDVVNGRSLQYHNAPRNDRKMAADFKQSKVVYVCFSEKISLKYDTVLTEK